MNSHSNLAVSQLISSHMNVSLFSPAWSPLIFYDPLVLIIPDQKHCMVDLRIWFARKCSSSVKLPVISADGNHQRAFLKQVNYLRISDIVVREPCFATVSISYVLSGVTANRLVAFSGFVWYLWFVRNAFFICEVYRLLQVSSFACSSRCAC